MPLENVNGRSASPTSPTGRTAPATDKEPEGNKLNQCPDHPLATVESRKKLSTLYILSNPAFVHPSSATAASTS